MTQISAEIIAHSTANGIDIITFELEYPRFIHSELMTHRVFSRNAASSRAIPIQLGIDMIYESPASPIHWGANQPGMQAKAEVEDPEYAKSLWTNAARSACDYASVLNMQGLHKQIVNRVLEPFTWMKTIVTTTELSNFFELRAHPDAQPEFQALANLMLAACNDSTPEELNSGEWHMPYVTSSKLEGGQVFLQDGQVITLEEALMVSASCCAQVSYRKLDDDLEKAKRVFDRLINSRPMHASPVEHQAKAPLSNWSGTLDVEDGFTHVDTSGYAWSGNFRGWIQHRQLL